MSKPVVLIAEELSPATVEALGPDFEIRYCDGADRAQLLPAIADVDAILVRSATKVDAEAIAAATRLKVIARAGVGLDNVDVKAATQAGVMVVNAPTSNIVSAAELAVGLLLASARKIVPANLSLKAGEWKRSKYTGVELTEKTVGIVGLGRIGILVAQRLSAFGVRLIAYDPYVQPARAAQIGVRMVTLEDLLAESDFITIHLPKTPETANLIDAEKLRLVKPTVHIINAARGGIIDEAALFEAMTEGRVAGAGLDVYASEPCTDSPLFGLESRSWRPRTWARPPMRLRRRRASRWRGRYAWRSRASSSPMRSMCKVAWSPSRSDPLLPLAEHLGQIASGLVETAVERVDIEVRGEAADLDVRVIELAALKGVFSGLVHDAVSFVNAPVLAEQRGVEVALVTDRESADHRTLVRVRLTLTDGVTLSVAGTVTGARHVEKLVEVDEFDVDVPISEHMALFRYHDRPGMVGVVGRLLGEASINIGGMQVSRDDAGGHALIVLTVDSPVPTGTLANIVEEIGAHTGRGVSVV